MVGIRLEVPVEIPSPQGTRGVANALAPPVSLWVAALASCDQTHECRGRRADLTEFVHNRATALLRTAYLLNGDQADAEDPLQSLAARHRHDPSGCVEPATDTFVGALT